MRKLKSKLEKFVKNNEFDFLISVSWRYLISPQVFEKAKIGSFNIHRGDLPKYAGVEPIKRALNNNETKEKDRIQPQSPIPPKQPVPWGRMWLRHCQTFPSRLNSSVNG